jgi:hypothetical protein
MMDMGKQHNIRGIYAGRTGPRQTGHVAGASHPAHPVPGQPEEALGAPLPCSAQKAAAGLTGIKCPLVLAHYCKEPLLGYKGGVSHHR